MRQRLQWFLVAGALGLVACATTQPSGTPSAPAVPAGNATKNEALLVIEEKDLNGNSVVVAPDIAIVDISSTLKVRVARDALARRVRSSGVGTSTQTIINDLTELQSFLDQAAAPDLTPLSEALSNWVQAKGSPEATKKLQEAYNKWGTASLKIMEYANVSPESGSSRARLREAFNRASERAIGQPIESLYAISLDMGGEELQRLRKELEAALHQEGIAFQMGAWVSSKEGARPIHLPNFDTYAPGERVEIDRFSIILTDAQKQQLRDAERLAKAINTRQFDGGLGSGGGQQLANLFASTNGCLGTLRERLLAFQNSGSSAYQTLKGAVEETRTSMEAYGAFMKGLETKYRSPAATTSSAEFLLGTYDDLTEASQRTQRLVTQLTALINGLEGQAKSLNAEGTELLKQLKGCGQTFSGELQVALNTLKGVVQPLASLQRVNTSALLFGQEVLRLELKDLPESTTLNLSDAGRRAPGDTVVIKFALQQGERPAQELETRQMQMQRVLVHLETVAGIIFAQQPRTVGGVSTASRFQAAPAYSVLFKGAMRDSSFWNNILTPGIGINLSALDFDKDSTPELGAAVTLALFRDFVQVGYGYNVFQDKGYFFFGVGLPLPVVGFSSGGASISSGGSEP